MARQHIISEFYLRLFLPDSMGTPLSAYNKREGRFEKRPAASFMAPADDHSHEIEQELGRVESDAAPAIRRLIARASRLPPGICALVGDEDPVEQPSVEYTEAGTMQGFKVHVAGRRLARATPADYDAIARFLTVAYSRAPNMEEAAIAQARALHGGLVWASKQLNAPRGPLRESLKELANARWFGLRSAGEVADELQRFQWWLVKAGSDERLVVGDSPVVAGLAVGEEGGWYPLLSDDTMLIALPLASDLALVISRQMIPAGSDGSGDEQPNIIRWLNRRSWQWARDFVFASDRTTLERVMADLAVDPSGTVSMPIDAGDDWFRFGARAIASAVLATALIEYRRDLGHRIVRCSSGRPMAHELVPAIRPIEI